MGSQCMRFKRLSASIKTALRFLRIALYACVKHACLHRLKQFARFRWYGVKVNVFHAHWFRRLLRFPLYGVKKHMFHTCLCIYLDDIRVFIDMGS